MLDIRLPLLLRKVEELLHQSGINDRQKAVSRSSLPAPPPCRKCGQPTEKSIKSAPLATLQASGIIKKEIRTRAS
jgi:hypothetical protein